MKRASAALLVMLMSLPSSAAEKAAPLSALASMPVQEITVFKDGHAFVLHRGKMAVDAAGNVLLDHLPTPVLGTFWPYSADPAVKLTGVVAGRRRVLVERTALQLRELLESNPGAEVVIHEGKDVRYEATIIGVPARSGDEVEATSAPGAAVEHPGVKGAIILLKTDAGTKVTAIDRITEVIFKKDIRTGVKDEEFRTLLTMRLDWGGKKPAANADVGMMYLQRGVRWIPNYRVTIDGKGKAIVEMQATIINEMVDLENVTLNMVVGVPTFAFKETIDPIALGNASAQLSQYFQENSQTAYALSNAMMTQQARMSEFRGPRNPAPAVGGDLGPDIGGAGKSEDLFLYTVRNVSLKRGSRMTVPVTKFELDYKDVYTLDMPFAPPPEVRTNVRNEQQAELAKLFNAPKAKHVIRLGNSSAYPLTTAPAMIVRDDRVVGQGMMTYTSPGAAVDLPLTTAIDIKVSRTDRESGRVANARNWNGTTLSRIDLEGSISLTNHQAKAVEIEVVRYVLGNVDAADNKGSAEKVNLFEDAGSLAAPHWWGWYSWPHWWAHVNGMGRLTWNIKLEPGKSADLKYRWHYYWH